MNTYFRLDATRHTQTITGRQRDGRPSSSEDYLTVPFKNVSRTDRHHVRTSRFSNFPVSVSGALYTRKNAKGPDEVCLSGFR